ncbi:MAG: tetratricopeptide repeat protein [Polyangia bacterium]
MKAPRRLRTVGRHPSVFVLFLAACVPRAETLRQSCSGGNMHACDDLGAAYAAGKEVAKDEVAAATLYKQACDGGETRGCYHLAEALATGAAVTRDEARAAELFRSSCVRGDGASCERVGEMYATGTGIATDERRAAAFFQRACDSKVILIGTNGRVTGVMRMDDAALSKCVADSMERAHRRYPSGAARSQPEAAP